MNLKVIWSLSAENRLDKIYLYYLTLVNERLAKKIILGIINSTHKLQNNPFLGQIEPLLKERTGNYRYLVYKNYKIIYSVSEYDKLIKIADVFDTRQNPEKLIEM